MKSFKIILLLLLAFAPACLWAQVLNRDLRLPYLAQEPSVSSPHPPVIILMHGYGSNEEDLFDLKNTLPPDFIVISVQAPISMGNNSYQWFRMDRTEDTRLDVESSMAKIKALIPGIVKKYHADPKRVYLSGFSQGGMMSYAVGLTSPELFKGIAPLSGRIFDFIKAYLGAAAPLKQLKIFIGHGDADTRVPYHFATDANTYLRQLGLVPELHTYKNMQHSINSEELSDLVKWLKQ